MNDEIVVMKGFAFGLVGMFGALSLGSLAEYYFPGNLFILIPAIVIPLVGAPIIMIFYLKKKLVKG